MVLIIVAILALVGGSAALLSRQGWPPLALPVLRQLGGEENLRVAGHDAADEANGTTREPEPIVAAIAAGGAGDRCFDRSTRVRP